MKSLKYIWLFCLTLATLGLVSCNDDDEASSSSPITVTQIYLEDADSDVPDRPVDFARLGQTIRIEGSGFAGLRELYINGFETYFNVAYVTNTNIIVSIDTDTPVSEADPEQRNTIRFVKGGTEYTYPFTIRAASPIITSIDNTLPMPGETVVVRGENLQETSLVTLPDGSKITDITNAPEDEDGEWFSFVMPSGVSTYGAITVTCANGTAVSPEYFNNRTCMILDFDGTGTLGYWGTEGEGSQIGETDLVDDPLNTGRGKVLQIVPQRMLDAGGVAAMKSRATECWTNGDDLDDWNWMTDEISDTTLLTDVALQFDIYVPDAWGGTGQIEVCLFNNFNFGGYNSDDASDGAQCAFYIPWIVDNENVPFHTTGWQTVTIPFSEFRKYAAEIEAGDSPTFREVIDERNAATYKNFGMGFVNTNITLGDGTEFESSVFTGRIYIDNWRIVPCASEIISDFPEEEE